MSLSGTTGGAVIAELRRAHGLSQEELAERSGVSARAIGSLERGAIARPRRTTLLTLARAFGIPETEQESFVERVRQVDHAAAAPEQLPLDDAGFVGRRTELDQLDRILLEPSPTRLVSIEGTGGLGKTQLALHWAHRAKTHFPDGQLFGRLQGFGSASPTAPTEVLLDFLIALGVPEHQIPADVDGRSNLFRRQLTNKRVLVVLDDARDAEQIVPLLPGGSTSATLITTRRRMIKLSTHYGCRRIALAEMSAEDASKVLTSDPVTVPDDQQISRSVSACAGLPLALRILAAQAQDHGWAYVLDQLDSRARLDAMRADSTTNVRDLLAASVSQLTPAATELFEIFGLVPTPDVDRLVLAAMTSSTLSCVDTVIDELVALHLVTPHGQRLLMHDLVQDYARERASTWRGETRSQAMNRLTRFVIDVADEARWARRIAPAAPPRQPRLASPDLELPKHFVQWVSGGQLYLTMAIDWVTATRPPELIHRLAEAVWVHRQRSLGESEDRKLYSAAAELARQADNQFELCRTLRILGTFDTRAGHWADARAALDEALSIARANEDALSEGLVHFDLGESYNRTGDYERALAELWQAADLCSRGGRPLAEATVLHNAGICCAQLGRFDEAEHWLTKALQAADTSTNSSDMRAWVLSSLGMTAYRAGDLERGEDLLRQAAEESDATWDLEIRTMIGIHRAEVAVAMGKLDLAEQFLLDVSELGWATLPVDTQNDLDNTRAELLLARAQYDQARTLYETVAQRAELASGRDELDRARKGLERLAHLTT